MRNRDIEKAPATVRGRYKVPAATPGSLAKALQGRAVLPFLA
jgi:hypothetical protein